MKKAKMKNTLILRWNLRTAWGILDKNAPKLRSA